MQTLDMTEGAVLTTAAPALTSAPDLGNLARIVCESGERNGFSVSLWDRLVVRIMKDLEFLQEFGAENIEVQKMWAEVLLDQAIGFLLLCGTDTDEDDRRAPSSLVDIAWHAFMLYSRDYARFCQRNFGSFIHHVPDDEALVETGLNYVGRTVDAMKERGLSVIDAAWPGRADCHVRCNTRCGDGR